MYVMLDHPGAISVPTHYGLTGHAIKNLKMPKKVRQDNKQAGTENVFYQKWKIIFSK